MTTARPRWSAAPAGRQHRADLRRRLRLLVRRYDSEGLVALADGSFWVSDEYGPFITHFDRNGTEIERLSPWGADAGHNVDTAHPLPAELTLRTKNKGMEGLTVTPDGRTLVGIMQSALTCQARRRSRICTRST
jgi:hypothetical protein